MVHRVLIIRRPIPICAAETGRSYPHPTHRRMGHGTREVGSQQRRSRDGAVRPARCEGLPQAPGPLSAPSSNDLSTRRSDVSPARYAGRVDSLDVRIIHFSLVAYPRHGRSCTIRVGVVLVYRRCLSCVSCLVIANSDCARASRFGSQHTAVIMTLAAQVPSHSDDLNVSFPQEHVLLLTLNRPRYLNAVSPQLNNDLTSVLRWFDDEPSLWYVPISPGRVSSLTGNPQQGW